MLMARACLAHLDGVGGARSGINSGENRFCNSDNISSAVLPIRLEFSGMGVGRTKNISKSLSSSSPSSPVLPSTASCFSTKPKVKSGPSLERQMTAPIFYHPLLFDPFIVRPSL